MKEDKVWIALLLLLPFVVLLHGYALSAMWAWFIVPAFGLPRMDVVTGMGVVVAAALFARRRDSDDPITTEDLAATIARPIFIVGLGWVVHLLQ